MEVESIFALGKVVVGAAVAGAFFSASGFWKNQSAKPGTSWDWKRMGVQAVLSAAIAGGYALYNPAITVQAIELALSSGYGAIVLKQLYPVVRPWFNKFWSNLKK